MSYIPVNDPNNPPQEDTDYILFNPTWVSDDNREGTAYGFLSDGEWYFAIWGFQSGTYRTIKGVLVSPTHYHPVPSTKHLQ